MRYKTACLAASMAGCAALGVAAEAAINDDPVLRLSLLDSPPISALEVPLRPRLEAPISDALTESAAPQVSVSEAGRVGKFAHISTPHPNLVVTVGATDDASELGRQIDRAILEMTRSDVLFNRQSDSAPFIGLGVRSGSIQTGWSADAAVGFGVFNPPDSSRLSGAAGNALAQQYQAEASAHFKLRYTF